MIVREPETNTEAPLLGKEGVALLVLWKAQMDWLSLAGQLKTPETNPPPDDKAKEHDR